MRHPPHSGILTKTIGAVWFFLHTYVTFWHISEKFCVRLQNVTCVGSVDVRFSGEKHIFSVENRVLRSTSQKSFRLRRSISYKTFPYLYFISLKIAAKRRNFFGAKMLHMKADTERPERGRGCGRYPAQIQTVEWYNQSDQLNPWQIPSTLREKNTKVENSVSTWVWSRKPKKKWIREIVLAPGFLDFRTEIGVVVKNRYNSQKVLHFAVLLRYLAPPNSVWVWICAH